MGDKWALDARKSAFPPLDTQKHLCRSLPAVTEFGEKYLQPVTSRLQRHLHPFHARCTFSQYHILFGIK